MCDLSPVKITSIAGLVAVTLIVIPTGVYVYSVPYPEATTTDVGVLAPWWSFSGGIFALALFVFSFTQSRSTCCGVIFVLIAVNNVLSYILWATKGNPVEICDGAADLFGGLFSCGASWIKYAIYILLVIAGVTQTAASVMSFGCGGGGGTANALGKSSATSTTARNLVRGARVRRGDTRRWARLTSGGNDVESQADYPLRRSSNTGGDSETDLSGSSDSEKPEWVGRRKSASR